MRSGVGIAAIHYRLPRQTRSLDQLAAAGLLSSEVKTLRQFGFRRAHIAEVSAHELARDCTEGLLREFEIGRRSVQQLLVASALPQNARAGRNAFNLFSYPATRLQAELGLGTAVVTAIHQAGCVSLFSAIHLAKSLIDSDGGIDRVLCVGSDVLPRSTRREILSNVISDGSCALLVDRGAERNRLLSYTQATRGFFWSPGERRYELIASYFPVAQRVIERAISGAGLKTSDIAVVLPHNVNRRSWEILLEMICLPPERLYDRNIARHGHTIAADPFINLRDAVEEGRIKRGDYLLLFSFGFGAHWACMIVQH